MKIELRPGRAAPLGAAFLCALLGLSMLWAGFASGDAGSQRFGLLCGAGALAWIISAALKPRLVIDDDGLTVHRFGRSRHVDWSDVLYYRYFQRHARRQYFPKPANRHVGGERVSIVVRGGPPIDIDDRYADLGGALDEVFDVLHARVEPSFQPLQLTDTALIDGKGTLELTAIDRVVISGDRFTVVPRGSTKAFALYAIAAVKNVMLLVEKLAEHGVRVEPSARLFIPRSALGKVEAAQSGLPSARVVTR